MFESIFTNGQLPATGFFIVLGVSLACGILFALSTCCMSKSSKSFAIAVALIPMAVAVVISLVNGKLGVGIAVAGAFGLVRFRSAPGTAREIAVIFISMTAGLAFGMGYLAYGIIFIIICGLIILGYTYFTLKCAKYTDREKIIKITIPEVLDYTSVFDDIFKTFTESFVLEKVKSINMGSMFRLSYRVVLKNVGDVKQMLDEIRTRNGNLEIQCLRADLDDKEL